MNDSRKVSRKTVINNDCTRPLDIIGFIEASLQQCQTHISASFCSGKCMHAGGWGLILEAVDLPADDACYYIYLCVNISSTRPLNNVYSIHRSSNNRLNSHISAKVAQELTSQASVYRPLHISTKQ